MIEASNSKLQLRMPNEKFANIYLQYANDVLKVCYFYLKDFEKAEDICQETFIKLITTNPELELGKEKAWLLKVAINKCKDFWRSSWFKKVKLGDDGLKFIADEYEDDTIKIALLNAIQDLTPKFKETILLHYYQGYGVTEIAEILNISQGTVSSRLSRAREKLAVILKGNI